MKYIKILYKIYVYAKKHNILADEINQIFYSGCEELGYFDFE